jgi:hypothetical protein
MHTPGHLIAAAASLAAALAWVPAHAQALYLGGAETSPHANYAYFGRLASIDHPGLQNGLAWRLWLDRAEYRYESNGRSYHGTATGIEAGVGMLFGSDPFTGSAFVSLVGRDTRITPYDPGNSSQGFHASIKLQTDLNYRFTRQLSGNLGASYTALGNAYWVRGRLLWTLPNQLRLGVEQAWHGDDHYRMRQTGLVLGGMRWGGADVTLKAGSRHLNGEGSAPYVGIELGWNF